VEATTGPLGQGLSNSVGFALAERFLAQLFNREGFPIVDHHTYVIASDGDLMEGVASEAASLAGHLGLGKLIVLYDDNDISLAAPTRVAFTEDVTARFEGYGWQVLQVHDGNTDVDSIRSTLRDALAQKQKPSLIRVKTIIGYGSPNKANSHASHGSPLGDDEVKAAKENLGWPKDSSFYVPDDVMKHFRTAQDEGKAAEAAWKKYFTAYSKKHPELAEMWKTLWSGKLPKGWEKALPTFSADEGSMATRKASGSIINALASVLPHFIGGSADLAPSTNTYMKDVEEQQKDSPGGRNIRFGVREHAMGSIVNGMAYHGGLIPYGGTFLTFSDYMRGAVRVSALSHLHTVWVWTHDSVWLGEDGPTHQPVEHLAALRAIPNLTVIRPADANETSAAWKIAVEHSEGPVALILSRQGLPILDQEAYGVSENVAKGAYVLSESDSKPEVILIATGSEISLTLKAQKRLSERGVQTRVVSMPSWELFEQQEMSYKNQVLPSEVKARVVIEAGVSMGWHKYAGDMGRFVCQDTFGASAPYSMLIEKFGFTPERVVNEALKAISTAKRS
jgi:transketolase